MGKGPQGLFSDGAEREQLRLIIAVVFIHGHLSNPNAAAAQPKDVILGAMSMAEELLTLAEKKP